MTSAPTIVVQDVTKRFRIYHERNQSIKASFLRRRRLAYEDFEALKDVSLEVHEGEALGLIGENGSGKSTLLKCMTRILRPDKGTIRVRGKASALLELGAGFHPELSGRENIYLNGSILGLSKKELDRKFDDIVGFAGLERFVDTAVKNYSSGMYVRLGFSVAINVEPDVLLIDEVLAVGDQAFQRRCTEKFTELRASGATIVLVTHAINAVRNLCDRAAWLEHGRVRLVGAADEVVEAYARDVEAQSETEVTELRMGSGEAVIETLELLDRNGSATTRFRTGDSVTVRLSYDSPDPIDKPVFVLGIFTPEGAYLCGPNMRDVDQVPDRIHGRGVVTFSIAQLLLVPGTYVMSVALQDYAGLHNYDFRHRFGSFEVEVGEPRATYGFMAVPGQWEVNESVPGGPVKG